MVRNKTDLVAATVSPMTTTKVRPLVVSAKPSHSSMCRQQKDIGVSQWVQREARHWQACEFEGRVEKGCYMLVAEVDHSAYTVHRPVLT